MKKQEWRLKGFLLISLALFTILLPKIISAQQELPTPTPIPTQVTEYARTFPNFLQCSQANQESIGLSWEGIVIGRSHTNELFEVVTAWSNNYSISARSLDSDIEYLINLRGSDQAEMRRAPTAVWFCAVDDIILILKVNYPIESHLYIEDLVAQYGIPQAISYDFNSPATRLVFWFEEGVAAQVTVLNEGRSYGRISSIIYFPPLQQSNFAQTWPYTHTVSGQSSDRSQQELEDFYGELNPFNFEVLAATVTAQPLRTLTPTFTALPPTSLATVTP